MPPLLVAIGGAIAAGGITGILTSLAVSIVASVVLSAVLPKPKVRAPSFAAGIRGRQDQILSPIAPFRTIYGEVMVAGTIVYIETYSKTGNQNERMAMVIEFASHEIDSIQEYWVDDLQVTLTGAEVNESPYAGFMQIYPHLGSPTQTVDTVLDADSSKWTSAHRLRGRFYLHVNMLYDEAVYSNGIPKIRVVARGKKVTDTRGSPDSIAWTRNPAWHIRDYLTSRMGFVDAEIDAATFEAAANVNDENVALALGGTEPRYLSSGVVLDDEQPGRVLQDLLSAMAGTLVNVGGVWKLYAGAASASVFTLDESHLRGPITITPNLSRTEIFNAVKPLYVDPTQDHQPTDSALLSNATYEAEDGGIQIVKNLELPYTQSFSAAQRLGKIELERSRNQARINFPGKPELLQLEVWDVVTLNIPAYYTSTTFRVIGVSIRDDMSVDLELAIEAAGMWGWSAEENPISSPDPIAPPITVTADPTSATVSTETQQTSDGVTTTYARLNWTPATDQFVTGYQIQYRKAGLSPPDPWETHDVVGQTSGSALLGPLINNTSYDFRIRSSGEQGPGGWVTPSGSPLTLLFDGTAPATPTGLTLQAGIGSLTARWTNPTDADFHHVEIFVRTDATTPTDADRVASPSGGRGAEMEYLIDQLAFPIQHWVWLKSVDMTGNRSDFTSPVSQTTRTITAQEIGDSILNTAMFASGIEPVQLVATVDQAASPPVPDPATWRVSSPPGAKIILATDTEEMWRWVDGSPPSFERLVKSGSMEDGAVTTPKINALAVTSNELAANAAIFGKVAAGAIKSAQIVSGEVKATNMAANSITAANAAIASLTVVDAKIANLTISTGKVANNAITAKGADEDAGFSFTTTHTQAANVSVTTSGGEVYILWQGYCGGNNLVTQAFVVHGELRRDSTVLLSRGILWGTGNGGFPAANWPVVLFNTDAPSAGTYTWDARLWMSGGGIPAGILETNVILVIELKK